MKASIRHLLRFELSKLSSLEVLLALEEAIESQSSIRYTVLDSRKILTVLSHDQRKSYFEHFNLFSSGSRLLSGLHRWVRNERVKCVSAQQILDQLMVMSEENKYKVIIVGDDFSLLQNVKQRVGNQIDIQVVSSNSSDVDIFQAIEEFRPDLALLDIARLEHEKRNSALFDSLEKVALVVDVSGVTKKWWTRVEKGSISYTTDLWDKYLRWISPNSQGVNIHGFDLSR